MMRPDTASGFFEALVTSVWKLRPVKKVSIYHVREGVLYRVAEASGLGIRLLKDAQIETDFQHLTRFQQIAQSNRTFHLFVGPDPAEVSEAKPASAWDQSDRVASLLIRSSERVTVLVSIEASESEVAAIVENTGAYEVLAGHASVCFERIELNQKLRMQQQKTQLVESVLGKKQERLNVMLSLADHNNMGYFEAGLDGELFDANGSFLEMVGATRFDLDAQRLNLLSVTSKESQPGLTDILLKLQQTGRTKKFEQEFVRPDGLTTPVMILLDFSPDNKGRIVGLVLNIAEQKQFEDSLERNEQRFRSLFETCGVSVIWLSKEGKILEWNPEAERIYGKKRDEVLGQNYIELFIAPALQDAVRKDIEKVVSGVPTRGYENPVIGADGVERIMLWNVSTLGFRGDKHNGIIAIGQDITESKKAEIEIRASEARFRALFESAPIGMSRTSLAGETLEVNQAFLSMVGYTKEEISLCQKISHPDDSLDDIANFNQLIAGSISNYRIEKRFIHKSGRIVWGRVFVSLVKGGDGLPAFAVGIIEDITNQKELESQLEQAAKVEAIGKLAGGIAHDFNNLLSIILGYSDILVRKDKECVYKNQLEGIRGAAERASRLTKQLLTFSRKQNQHLQVVHTNTAINDVKKLLIRLVGEKINFVTNLEESVGNIRVDTSQFEQVLMNLIVNARDAMPEGGELRIATANVKPVSIKGMTGFPLNETDCVKVSISDTGTGMSEDVKERLFEPFFTTKESGHGTGLGLATVLGIVQQSKGEIEVVTEEGKGTTFHLYFSRSYDPVEVKKGAASVMGDPTEVTGTIMVVEDDVHLKILMESVLVAQGYSVLVARSAEEALGLFEKTSEVVQLLVTDIGLPGKSGPMLAQEIRAKHPHIGVLFISGYSDADRESFTGTCDHMDKPFTPDHLLSRIAALMPR